MTQVLCLSHIAAMSGFSEFAHTRLRYPSCSPFPIHSRGSCGIDWIREHGIDWLQSKEDERVAMVWCLNMGHRLIPGARGNMLTIRQIDFPEYLLTFLYRASAGFQFIRSDTLLVV